MSNYNRNDDFVSDFVNDLIDAGDSVFDAARAGRDEILRAARNSMRSYWGDADSRTTGQYNRNYYSSSSYNPGQVQPHNSSADYSSHRTNVQQPKRPNAYNNATYTTGNTTYSSGTTYRSGSYNAGSTTYRTAQTKKTSGTAQAKSTVKKSSVGGLDWAGLIFGGLFGISGVEAFIEGFRYIFQGYGSWGWDSIEGGLICALFAGLLIGNFVIKKKREGRYAEYLSIIGSAAYYSTKKLAKMVGVKESTVEKDLSRMIRKGLFGKSGVYIDRSLNCIVMDQTRFQSEVQQMKAEEAERAEKEESAKAQQSAAEATKETEKKEEAADPDGLPKEYEELLRQLRTLNEQIPDAEMTERIYRIESVTRATFLAVRDNPEKLSSIRSFMNYYLPTTIKLLTTYADFDKQTVQGENIRKSKEQIANMTETLAEAFEKQFDSLFKTEAMDIDTEIRAMDGKLKQDGLVDNIFSSGLASQVKKEKE